MLKIIASTLCEILAFSLILCVFINDAVAERFDRLPDVVISDIEIVNFVNDLRQFDTHKANPSQIQLDYQGHTSTRDEQDNARFKLFKRVDEALLRTNTAKAFIALHDNYNFDTGKAENETESETKEITEFLEIVTRTRLFRYLRDFLREKGHPIAESESTFRKWISQLWFGQYSRARGAKDTSGFEHVFLGEGKNGELVGMHNWLRFYLLERNMSLANHFDYKGFLVKRYNVFAAVKFSYGRYLKRSGSFLIGTSPEFDLALYTFCFLTRRGHHSTCNFEFDGCPVSITNFDIVQNSRIYVGTIYPSAGRMTATCRKTASRNDI